MIQEVTILQCDDGMWQVSALDDDGGIESAVFSGPRAERRADEYAAWMYPDVVPRDWLRMHG